MPTANDVVDLTVLGVTVRVHGAGHEFAAAVRDVIAVTPPTVELSIDRTSGAWRVSEHPGGGIVSISAPAQQLTEHLVSVLNQVGLDHDVERLHVHAALVEVADAGIVIAGPSGAGKSTLTAALVERGANYLNDETVGLWPSSLAIAATPKPVTLKSWSIARFAPHLDLGSAHVVLPASSLGSVACASVPQHLVFPAFVEGATTTLERVRPPEALARLVAQSLDAARYGAGALAVLAHLVGRTSSWALTYGSLEAAADLVEGVAAESPRPTPWRSEWRGRSALAVVMDEVELVLDVRDGTLRARRTDGCQGDQDAPEPQSARENHPTPQRRLASVIDAFNHLDAEGIPGLIADESLLIGSDTDSTKPPFVVVPAMPSAQGLVGTSVRFKTGLVDAAGATVVGYHDLNAAATPVRLDGVWRRGLHPRHRFLAACLEFNARPDPVAAALVNRVGMLPAAGLRRAFAEAETAGSVDLVRRAVIDAAGSADGVSRDAVEVVREWASR